MVESIFRNAVDTLTEDDQTLPQVTSLLPMVMRGVAVHHSGLLPVLKELVEILFQVHAAPRGPAPLCAATAMHIHTRARARTRTHTALRPYTSTTPAPHARAAWPMMTSSMQVL
jgi:hypothetical protein